MVFYIFFTCLISELNIKGLALKSQNLIIKVSSSLSQSVGSDLSYTRKFWKTSVVFLSLFFYSSAWTCLLFLRLNKDYLILKTFNAKKVHNLSHYDKDTQKWGKREFLQVGLRRLPVVDRCSSVIYQTRLLRPPAWPTAAFGWTSEKGYLCISRCYHLVWQNKDLLKRPK